MLELKIESMRARGEISTEERDLLLAGLKKVTGKSKPAKKTLLSPLRLFLAGMICGVALAYLVWGIWGGPPSS